MSHSSPQLSQKTVSAGQDARLLGKWGEQLVAAYLIQKGWRLRETNYRCRMGEIDLIAENHSYLIFVEVKLRKSTRFGQAGEAVDYKKQQRLRATAELYLAEHHTKLQPRFDVAEVYAPQGISTVNPGISYLENAF